MSNEVWKNPTVSKVSVEFVQDGNTLGTTDEVEEITIELQYQMPGEEPFIVIKTKGWSINDPEDIDNLVTDVLQIDYFLKEEDDEPKST